MIRDKFVICCNWGKVGLVSTNLDNPKKSALKNAQGENTISLHYYFDHYQETFAEILSKTGSEFLGHEVEFKLVGISDVPSPLWKDNDYFVTQMNVTREHSLVIKVSDAAANFVFRTALGDRPKEKGYLKLKEITELEVSILNAFNEFLFKKVSGNFLSSQEIKAIESKIINEERTIYLTFYIFGDNDYEAGRIIFSFPEFAARTMIPVGKQDPLLVLDYFNNCLIETDIIAGYSRITLDDVKNLDVEDIVILEKSNLYSMILKNHENLKININPDPNIVIDIGEEDGETIVDKKIGNIWDSLEVDLSAEFDKVKVRLGDLRQVVEGLVIDIAPVAQNKIFLNVEGKQIAAGELVIVGDKYGVKITEVNTEAKVVNSEAGVVEVYNSSGERVQNAEIHHPGNEENIHNTGGEVNDSDFDFSDYEIEEDV